MFYLVTSLLCFFSSLFPLLFKVGKNLEYEYIMLGLFALYSFFIIAGFLLPKILVRVFLKERQRRFGRYLFQVFILGPFVFCLIPFFLFSFNLCACSVKHFWTWFFINLYPAFILAHGLFYLILLGRVSKKNKKLFLSLPFLLFFVSVLQSLVFFLIFPQKRQTHLLFSHLHGPIYDFFIWTDFGIFLGRFSHALFACFFLFALLRKKTLSIIFLLFSLAFYLASFKQTSLQYGIEALEKNFKANKESKDFILYYNENSHKKERIEKFEKEILFHIKELKTLLSLEKTVFVKIFLYDSIKQKKLLFGAAETDVADVFTPSIHLGSNEFPHRTLRHELVHALLSKEAPVIWGLGLGFHPNMALTEGFAVALAPAETLGSLHKGAAYLLEHKKVGDVRHLFSPFFWKYSGSQAYTVAGSLIQFLLNHKGAAYVKGLYGSLNFKKPLGEDEKNIIESWKKFIKKYYEKKKDDLVNEKYYRYPGLLQDKCPHSKAELRTELKEKPYIDWRRTLDSKDSHYFLRDLRFKLLEAKKKGEKEFLNQAKANLALALEFEKDKNNNYDFYELRIIRSDLERIIGKEKESLRALEFLHKAQKKGNLGQSLSRQILARRLVEEELKKEAAYSWRLYLAGYGNIPKKIKNEEEPWILEYLRYRNKVFSGNFEAEDKFKAWQAYFVEKKPEKIFYKEWLRLLARKSSKNNSYEAALFWEELAKYSKGRSKELYKQYARLFGSL